MNIFQAIPAAMADVEPIAKGRRNKEQGFQFRGIDDIMNELQPVLKQHGLFVVPKVRDVIRQEKTSKSGSVLLYSIVTMDFTMYASDGSFVTGATVGEGMDSGDKASNKAMAVAFKYFLLQTFCIPTEDAKDPDAESYEVAAHETTAQPGKPPSNEYVELKDKLIDWLNATPRVFTDEQAKYAENAIAKRDIAGMRVAIEKAVEKSKAARA